MSHETIYKSLFIQARGVLKKELIKHLRSGRRFRYARRSASEELRGKIPDTISIRERPAEADDRAIPGHWEGDLLCGTKSSQIITLVERHSRYTALIKVADHKTDNVVAALTRHVRTVPNSLWRSLTWDHGKNLHRKLGKFHAYYNGARVHRSLDGTTSENRAGYSSSSKANLSHCVWKRHCNGLFETPVVA